MNHPQKQPQFISVAQLAEKLGISRVAVFNRIKKGKIPAEKIGRAYAIPIKVLDNILQDIEQEVTTEEKKADIDKAVKKVVKEYGETLRLLGKE